MEICKRFPALYYAFAVLSGISLFYRFPFPLLLIFLSKIYLRRIGYLLLTTISFLRCFFLATTPPSSLPLSGVGIFSVHKIEERERGEMIYHGILELFE